jgi:hypothetical protein
VRKRITAILFPIVTFELYFAVKSTFSLGARPPPRLPLPSRYGAEARMHLALASREGEITEQTNRLNQSGQNID